MDAGCRRHMHPAGKDCMQELSLRRLDARDLPSHGPSAAALLAVGPADRIGPLRRSGRARSNYAEGPLLPALLLALALASAAGTYALMNFGPRPKMPLAPAAVAPPPPETPPVVERIPEAVSAPPPEPVVATPPPVAPQVATQPPARPAAKEPVEDPAPVARTRPAAPPAAPSGEARRRPADEDAGPAEPARRRAVRTIRRPARPAGGPAAPGADVETTGTGRARPATAPAPKNPKDEPAGSWTLPSILRPGGI